MVNEHTINYHLSPSEIISSIRPLIFLYLSPQNIFWFFSETMVLRLLKNTFVSYKIEFVRFYSCPQQNSPLGFYHHRSKQKEITHFPKTKFLENIFFPSREGEDYGVENIIKIKLARVLVTIYINSAICNLYIFVFCYAVPWFRFKHAEVGRFFNLTSFIFTKKYRARE